MFSSPKKELKDTLGVVQQVCYLDSDDGIENVAYVQIQRFPVNQLSSKKVVIKKKKKKKKLHRLVTPTMALSNSNSFTS